MTNYAFIDSQNVYRSIRQQGWTIDWRRFRVYLLEKYRVQKAYIFIGYIPGNEALYASLRASGFVVIHKPTVGIRRGEEIIWKGYVDAELVLHTMIEWNNYDKALIVSGDGDFHCLVEHLLKHDKLLTLLIPNSRKYSALLREFREYIAYMDTLITKIGRAHNKNERE